MSGVGLAATGMALVLLGWVTYLATVPRGTVPVVPTRHMIAEGVGLLLAIGALTQLGGASLSVVIAIGLMTTVSVTGGSLFFFLLTQRKTPIGDITIAVGDTLPRFTATDHEGAAFDSESLRGERVLLKFFRGHW